MAMTVLQLENPLWWKKVKHAYHHKCIQQEFFTRLVADADLFGSYTTGCGTEKITNIRPATYRETMDESYGLVLSLCTDGKHRVIYDHDKPEVLEMSGVWVPSTTNWHRYTYRAVDWDEATRALYEYDNSANQAYWKANAGKGWQGVRPPWNSKEDDGVFFHPVAAWEHLPWRQVTFMDKDETGSSWEELGWSR